MADRIYARMHATEAPCDQADLDRAGTDPERYELRAHDRAELPGREASDRLIRGDPIRANDDLTTQEVCKSTPIAHRGDREA